MKRYLVLATLTFAAIALTACATTGTTDSTGAADDTAQHEQDAAPETVMNWYGGPAYVGEPALEVTAALVRAGGGVQDFSFATALAAVLGQDTFAIEIAKLKRQYGEQAVENFMAGMNYATTAGLQRARRSGITLPAAPADLQGAELAKALIEAGTAADGTFWAGRMFDVLLSHKLHNQVMTDINATLGTEVGLLTHQILNQLMYDTDQVLGLGDVKLASLH